MHGRTAVRRFPPSPGVTMARVHGPMTTVPSTVPSTTRQQVARSRREPTAASAPGATTAPGPGPRRRVSRSTGTPQSRLMTTRRAARLSSMTTDPASSGARTAGPSGPAATVKKTSGSHRSRRSTATARSPRGGSTDRPRPPIWTVPRRPRGRTDPGEEVTVRPDGTVVTMWSEGSSLVEFPDGREQYTDPWGNTSTTVSVGSGHRFGQGHVLRERKHAHAPR